MLDAQEIINKLGIATSKDVQEILDIHIRNVIRQLTKSVEHGEIGVMVFHSPNNRFRKRVYIQNEIYNSFCSA